MVDAPFWLIHPRRTTVGWISKAHPPATTEEQGPPHHPMLTYVRAFIPNILLSCCITVADMLYLRLKLVPVLFAGAPASWLTMMLRAVMLKVLRVMARGVMAKGGE